ncbi:hypothetical protein L6R53_04220 [Myxococcota bacterium]|nr:hypothetical protein [Myxococcota bacterium]
MYLLSLLTFLSCSTPQDSLDPVPCAERPGDQDCDGVPDTLDQCPDSDPAPKDAVGCTEQQMAGCQVNLYDPTPQAPGAEAMVFSWSGTCQTWLLQFSPDADFLAGRTQTAVRTSFHTATVVPGGRWWRVQGGMPGNSRVASSEPRYLP